MNEIRIVDPKTGALLGRITNEGTEITEAWKKADEKTEEPEEVKESDDRTDRTGVQAKENES